MKARWPRSQPLVALGPAGVERLLHPIYSDAQVIEVTPLAGGLCNTNLRVRVANAIRPLLLRLYQREPSEMHKEAALAAFLAERIPVARFLHFADDNAVTGHPYAVLDWIEGQRLDDLLSYLDESDLSQLGALIGGTLSTIHGIPFERYGFFADDLSLVEAIDLDSQGVLAFLRHCLTEGPCKVRLGDELAEALLSFMERESGAIDDWLPPPCLVHGDFNPANLLVRRDERGDWELAAVLDWEFALSGTPPFDLGNLLRPPLGQHRGFVEALAEGYCAAGGFLPKDWQHIARLVDLTAWTEMLSRPTCAAEVIVDAQSIIHATTAEEVN